MFLPSQEVNPRQQWSPHDLSHHSRSLVFLAHSGMLGTLHFPGFPHWATVRLLCGAAWGLCYNLIALVSPDMHPSSGLYHGPFEKSDAGSSARIHATGPRGTMPLGVPSLWSYLSPADFGPLSSGSKVHVMILIPIAAVLPAPFRVSLSAASLFFRGRPLPWGLTRACSMGTLSVFWICFPPKSKHLPLIHCQAPWPGRTSNLLGPGAYLLPCPTSC